MRHKNGAREEMNGFVCDSFKFLSKSLNGLALGLSELPVPPWDKVRPLTKRVSDGDSEYPFQVKQLFSVCPDLTKKTQVLNDRHQAGVIALGLFALKTQLKVIWSGISVYYR